VGAKLAKPDDALFASGDEARNAMRAKIMMMRQRGGEAALWGLALTAVTTLLIETLFVRQASAKPDKSVAVIANTGTLGTTSNDDGAVFYFDDGRFQLLRRGGGSGSFNANDLEYALSHPYNPHTGRPPCVLVAGITTKLEVTLDNLKRTAAALDQPFILVNNASEGFWRDLRQTAADLICAGTSAQKLRMERRLRRIARKKGWLHKVLSLPVQAVVRCLGAVHALSKRIVERHTNPAAETLCELMLHAARSGQPIIALGHSQGGTITSLAAFKAVRALASGDRGRLEENVRLLTCGGGGNQFPRALSQIHVATDPDLISRFMGLGNTRFRPKSGERVHRLIFDGSPETGFKQRKWFSPLPLLAARRRQKLLSNRPHTLKDTYVHVLPRVKRAFPAFFSNSRDRPR
jgi:hypothetical protein